MRRKSYKRQTIAGWFGKAEGEHDYRFPEALFTSEAWLVLTPSQRNILLDWIRAYFHASSWETKDITHEGFVYPWSACDVDVCESTFTAARQQICKVGFFESPVDLQDKVWHDGIRFIPSDRWRRYKAMPEERRAWRSRRGENGIKASCLPLIWQRLRPVRGRHTTKAATSSPRNWTEQQLAQNLSAAAVSGAQKPCWVLFRSSSW